MKSKNEKWSEELLLLSSIAQIHLQAAYAAFMYGMASKWMYLTRTMEDIGPLLQPLENIIRTRFIPTLCGGPAPNDEQRDLLALPCRLGGLGIHDPTHMASHEHCASREITTPIVRSIFSHEGIYTHETLADQLTAVTEIRKRKRDQLLSHARVEILAPSRIAKSHGPLKREGGLQLANCGANRGIRFLPSQGCLIDALALRYNWPLHRIPSTCPCGSNFTV